MMMNKLRNLEFIKAMFFCLAIPCSGHDVISVCNHAQCYRTMSTMETTVKVCLCMLDCERIVFEAIDSQIK
jgi:hypothetical protein